MEEQTNKTPGELYKEQIAQQSASSDALSVGKRRNRRNIVLIVLIGILLLGLLGGAAILGFKLLGDPQSTVQKQKGTTINNNQTVLSGDVSYFFTVNTDSIFNEDVKFMKAIEVNGPAVFNQGLVTNNQDVDLGTGIITAGNIPDVFIQGLTAGGGISIAGDPENPVITNTGVISVNGSTGAVTLNAGSGISISGTTISSTVTSPSASNSFANILVPGQSTLTAGSSNDSLTITPGAGITLTTNSGTKELIIASSGGGSQWTTSGSDIYYNSGNVGIGTANPGSTLDVTGTIRFASLTNGVLKVDGSGNVTASAVNLTSDVTGVLPVANGGTGASSLNDLIALGTMTTGNYVAGVIVGNGLAVTGSATEGWVPGISLDVTTSGTTATIAANSGLETSADGLSLIRGCQMNEILKWSGTVWQCDTDSGGGGGGGITNIQEGGVNIVTTATAINFVGNDFVVTNSGGGTGAIAIDYTNSKITRSDQNESITGTWTFDDFTINGDTFTDLTGTGLQINAGVLETTLGTSVDLTSEVSGILPLANGGTAKNLTAVNGGIVYSDADSFEILVAGISGYVLQSNGAGAPSWVPTAGLGTNYWQRVAGNLSPVALNDTLSATTSAATALTITQTGAFDVVRFEDQAGDTTPFFIDQVGNVGIGTTVANDVISIVRPQNTTTRVTLENSSGGNAARTEFFVNTTVSSGGFGVASDAYAATPLFTENTYLYAADGASLVLDTRTATPILFGTNDTERMRLDVNGNLGIGITNPVHKLSVNGTGSITGLTTFGAGVNVNSETITDFTGTGLQLNAGVLEAILGTSVSLTTEVSGILPMANGGTNASLTAAAGGIIYSDADSMEILAAGTAGYVLQSNGAGAPSWVPASGVGTNYWQQNSGSLAPLSVTNSLVIGGATTTPFFFEVNGAKTGKALVSLNETGNQNILTASASGTTRFNLTNTGNVGFAGNTAFMNTLTSVATANRTYTLPDTTGTICIAEAGNCAGSGTGITGSGTATQLAFFSGGTQNLASDSNLYWNNTSKLLGIGTSSPVSKLDVSGAVTGKALVSLNETGDQPIFTASASGTTRFNIANNGIVTASAYGSGIAHFSSAGVISSSAVNLTSADVTGILPVLNGGTGANTLNDLITLGTMTTGNYVATVTGNSQISVAGTPGEGWTAALSIAADSIGDSQLAFNTGQDLTTTSSPTFNGLTVSTLTRGVDTISDFTGNGIFLNFGALSATLGTSVDLTTEVIGVLPLANGGSNKNLTAVNGGIVYSDTDSFEILAAGTSGYVLQSNGAGAPSWVPTAGLGTNYWQRVSGNLSPVTLNDTLSATTSAATALTITQTGAFDVVRFEDQASDTTPFIITQTGNVGIGTTAPGQELEVAGDILIAAGGIIDTSAAGTLGIGTTTQNGLTLGRVGAGTTINGSGLTVGPTAWTATPTISGLITATSGLTADGALTANNTFTLGDNGDTGSINTSDWDISTTGVLTGISGITTDGGYTQSGSTANLFTGPTTISATGTALTISGAASTGLLFSNTGITTDITLQNGESIDNNTDGTITLTSTTLALSGTTTLSGASLTAINGGATAIDFTEFDVSASTGSITINDGGDLGNISIEGTIHDIDSLDFVGVGAITTGGSTDLTITPAGGNVLFGNNVTLNVGGAAATAYNFFAGTTAGSTLADSDNDLYIEGELEVDGGALFSPAGTDDVVFTTDADTDVRFNGLSAGTGNALCIDTGSSDRLVTCTVGSGGVSGSGTSGQISFFNGTNSITSETSGFAWDATNKRLGLGTNTPDAKLQVTGANVGKALAILNETGDQNVLSASASGTTVFNLTRAGVAQFADLTLGLNDASATISTQDTDEALTIDPNGTGIINFHSSSNTLSSTGDLILAGDLRLNGNDIADSGGTNRIGLGATTTLTNSTFTLSGTTIFNGTSLTAINGGATAIDFTEFDVSASTGSITINDGGDAGNVSIEGTIIDINSLDFVGVGAITTGGSTDLTLSPSGNNVILSDNVLLNVGGIGAVAYNAIADSGGGTSHGLSSDDDLFVEGDFEVDGSLFLDGAFNCTDCIDFDDMVDAMTLDASTSIAFGASNFGLTFTNNGTGDETHNLSSTGDFIIQDNGTPFASFLDTGAITFAPTSGTNFAITTAGAGNMSLTSGVTTGTTTASALALIGNSLTSGTGFYAGTTTLQGGKLVDLQISGTAAAANQTALNLVTTGANATGGITTYGARISNTHSGSTSTNIALYLAATGGTSNNYALITDGGNVGIGITNPSRPIHTYGLAPDISNGSAAYLTSDLTSTTNNQMGMVVEAGANPAGAASRSYIGIIGSIVSSETGTDLQNSTLVGLRGSAYLGSTGTFGEVKGGDYTVTLDAAGNITSAYGLMVNSGVRNAGTISNLFGLAVNAQTAGTNNAGLVIGEATGTNQSNLVIGQTSIPTGTYSIYNSSTDQNYIAGNVGIGTTTPTTFKLELAGSIGPSADDTYDLGSDARRFRDLYLGGDTLHIGTSTSDEYAINYDTTNNRLGFNVNGSGDPELVMDSSGNLGIGNTNPGAKLSVNGNGTARILVGDIGTTNFGGISFNGALTTTNYNFAGSTAGTLYINRPTGSQIQFLQNNVAEMTIDSTGNVGMGVQNYGFGRLSLRTDNASTNSLQDVMSLWAGTTGGTAANGLGGSLRFLIEDTTAGNSTYYTGAKINSLALDTTAGSFDGALTFDTTLNNTVAEKMRLDNNGNLGIGTTVPTEKLQVAGNIQLTGNIKATTAPTATTTSRTTTTVDNTGATGQSTAAATGTDGLPVIAFYEGTPSDDLKVTKCGNAACSSGNTTTTVDSTANVGYLASIAIGTDGFPVIAYMDQTNSALKVAKCGNAACSSGNTVTTVASSLGGVGNATSIAIGSDGFPVISYYNTTADSLNMAKCANAACSSGTTLTTVDTTGSTTGYTSSIAIGTDGFPVISYLELGGYDLEFAKCGNLACSSGNTLTTIDSTGSVGSASAVTIGADGYPIIAYIDITNDSMKVAKCGNASCSSGNTLTTVYSAPIAIGSTLSITLGSDDLPVISFADGNLGDLLVAKCGNNACSSYAITTIDSTGSVGSYSSITIGGDGNPAISYYDVTNTSVKLARCVDPSCGDSSATVYSGGQDIGSDTTRFNNIYGTNLYGTNLNITGDAQVNGVIKGADIGAKVSRSTNQAITVNTATAVTFDTEVYDTDNIHSTSSNTSRLTANTAGKYVINGGVTWTVGTNTDGAIYIYKNGGTLLTQNRVVGYYLGMNASVVVNLEAGDYVELLAYYNGGSARSVDASTTPNSPSFSMQRISGADLAEYYPISDPTIREGDIVSIDLNVPGAVRKASSAYEKNLGIISANPAIIMGNTPDKEGNKAVGLKGKVPVKVSTRNGVIKNGDPITTSIIPGVGMKAGQAGHLAAVALDDFDPSKMQCENVQSMTSIPWPAEGDSLVVTGNGLCYRLPDGNYVGEILAYIDNSFYEPYTITASGNVKVTNLLTDNVYPMTLDEEWETDDEGTVTSLFGQDVYEVKVGDETVKRQGLFSEIFSGTITAGLIDAKNIKIGGKSLVDFFNELNGKSATGSGTLSASGSASLSSHQKDIDDLKSQMASLSARFASIESLANQAGTTNELLGQLLASPTLSASGSGVLGATDSTTESLVVGDTLQVLGRTTLTDLGVTGNITAGVMSLNGLQGAINTVGEPLRLQNLGVAGVDILDGKITIDTEGNMVSAGEITVKKLNISEGKSDEKSIGDVLFKAGETSIEVDTTALTDKSRIFVTPERPTTVGAKRVEANTFRIELNAAPASDLKVNWWIVN